MISLGGDAYFRYIGFLYYTALSAPVLSPAALSVGESAVRLSQTPYPQADESDKA